MPDLRAQIEDANRKVLEIMLGGRPRWVDVRPALEVVPGMAKNMILHAGPPIEWKRMCGPQSIGVVGAALHEGLAGSKEEAAGMLLRGEIVVSPCHHHDSACAGTGITSASTPMLVILNETHGNYGYSNLFETGGLNQLKWGVYDEGIAEHLRWEARELAPALSAALKLCGGIDVKSIVAKAVQMGDECHNRSIAASSLLFREIVPPLLKTDVAEDALHRCVTYMAQAEHFFLHVVMGAAKALLMPAEGVPYATVVTTMCRNGVDFGVRLSAMGDQWFIAPAGKVDGLYFRSMWGPHDAAPDLGDSCITETVGLGGMIQAAAPSVQQYVRGTLQQALRNTAEMKEICVGVNQDYRLPNLDFEGGPIAIDARKAVRTGIAPLIETGITHKNGGLIGAGEVRAPMACFEQALRAFSAKYSR